MRPIRSRSPKTSARDQHGFTVLEITVVVSVFVLVAGALLTTFVSAQRSQAFVTDRSQALDGLRMAMNQMTKEVRQATWVDPASTTSSLRITTYVNSLEETITWRVVAATARLERVDGLGNVVPVLDRVVGTTPFAYSPTIAAASVLRVWLQAKPKNSPNTVLELTSELRLRNR